jgi:hypothetical protein
MTAKDIRGSYDLTVDNTMYNIIMVKLFPEAEIKKY